MEKHAAAASCNLLETYRTTAENALSREETLHRLRASGLSAMIDAENVLWINERCMGPYDCIHAQNQLSQS